MSNGDGEKKTDQQETTPAEFADGIMAELAVVRAALQENRYAIEKIKAVSDVITTTLALIRSARDQDRNLLEAILRGQSKITEKIESVLTESADAQELVPEGALESPPDVGSRGLVEPAESDGSGVVEEPPAEES